MPFGWGQNPEDNENDFENRIEVSDRATLKGSLAAINPLAMIQRRSNFSHNIEDKKSFATSIV